MKYGIFLLAYLFGSIPSAVWFGKLIKGVDVREHGSGNAGATNTFRVLGWKVALPVFIFDVLKGYAAVKLYVWSGVHFSNPDFVMIILGILAVAGHIFPVFAGFKGGKGVATLLGVMIALAPLPTLYAAIVFIIVFALSNIVSLSSLLAGLSLPIVYYIVCGANIGFSYLKLGFFVFVFLLLTYTHRSNIKRIFEGTESKIYFSKKRKERNEK